MHSNAIVAQHGIVEWPWKFVQTYYPYDRHELYNLDNDPGERRNLIGEEIPVLDRLRRDLDGWVERQLLYYSDEEIYLNFAPPGSRPAAERE